MRDRQTEKTDRQADSECHLFDYSSSSSLNSSMFCYVFYSYFFQFDIYFKSYLHYVLDQKASAEYFKQRLGKDDLFQYLITVRSYFDVFLIDH